MNILNGFSIVSYRLKLFPLICSALCLAFLPACDLGANLLKADREGSMGFQDYRDAFAPRQPEVDPEKETAKASIPDLQPYISSPGAQMKNMPLVSISVNQSVPLRDLLFELAKQTDYDLILDPAIRGAIIFTARQRPLDEVIDKISEIAGLRYKFADDVLRVEVDRPYNKLYKVDYLSYVRSSSGQINNDVSVVSGEGTDTGSNFEASSSSEADFWGQLEAGLTQLLSQAEQTSLATRTNPRITAADQSPNVQAVRPPQAGENIEVQPPRAVLRVDSLPAGDDGDAADEAFQATFSINSQAGIINVFATDRIHEDVQEYLSQIRRAVTSQVLIEAKILEVTLDDEHATGIDWSNLNFLSGEFTTSFTSGGFPLSIENALDFQSGFAASFDGNDVSVLARALSEFGTVRALASPRLTVLNNQPAVLNVATNRVFFELDAETEEDEDTNQTDITIESEIRNVPEGVLVNVQPSIDLDTNTISLAVRPTITRIVGTRNDPGVSLVASSIGLGGQIESPIPELSVQEIDSVLQVNSGEAVVMGGLLQDRVIMNEEGIPVLAEVPMVGRLFKQHSDIINKTELVIFLKATILRSPSDSVHNTDRDLYRRFSSDRRPLRL